eukprot:2153922-Amphidinium_carterae.1
MEVNVGHVVVAHELIDVAENVEVLVEVDVKVVEVHVSSIDEVEVLCLDTVLAEHLMFPLLVNVLDVLAANHKVDVGRESCCGHGCASSNASAAGTG